MYAKGLSTLWRFLSTRMSMNSFPSKCRSRRFYLTISVWSVSASNLNFVSTELRTDQAVAFDLFPTSQTDIHEIMSGEAKIDIGEGLRYLLLATPAAPLANAAKCLKLDISIPFKWTSETATVQSSNRMTNPTMWYVRDEAIRQGFSPSVVIRVPKQGKLTVRATMSGDLRQRGLLGKMVKAQFKSFEPRTYEVGLVPCIRHRAGAKLAPAQRETFNLILSALAEMKFDRQSIEAKTAGAGLQWMTSITSTDEDQRRMGEELDDWVRWYRLSGYYLAFAVSRGDARPWIASGSR
jgi:hypothetical protein